WAVHEIRRNDVFLDDLPLGNGSDASTDGIPADYLRNYFDYVTTSGMNVQEALRQEIESSVTSLIDNGFGTTSGINTQYVNQIEINDQNVECTSDADFDSADELAGLPNDAYNPPICLRTTLGISVDPASIGMTVSGLDVERTYQGLLTMGGTVTTEMNLTALPGHFASFEFIPPSYGTLLEVDSGGETIQAVQGGYTYDYGRWNIDHLSTTSEEWQNQSASITIARRTTTTKAVEIDLGNDRGVSMDVLVDASNEHATNVEISMGLHHIGSDTLSDWGWDFVDERVTVPWVTSDGMRLAHHTGLADLSDFADRVPVDELNDLVNTYSPTPISFTPFEYAPADQLGGLDFIHSSNTCNEISPSFWCVQGPNAMNGTFPLYLSSESNTFDLDVVEMINSFAEDFDVDLHGFNPNVLTDEDFAALMNAGRFSGNLPTGKLTNWISEDLPPADITVTILLPSWIRSTEGVPESLTFEYTIGSEESHEIALTGNNPYNWEHAICQTSNQCGEDSLDFVCGANRRTCMAVNIDLNIEALDIHEWSKTIEMVTDAEIEILLYRIGVPDSVSEKQDNVVIEAIPSDLIRRGIQIGDSVAGGLLGPYDDELTVPIGDDDVPLSISADGINLFADDVAQIYERELNEVMRDAESEIQQEDSPVLMSASQIYVGASVSNLDLGPGSTLRDDRPIRIVLEIDIGSLKAEWVGGSMGITGAISSLTQTMLSVTNIQHQSATGDISGFEITEGNEIEEQIYPIAEDFEGELVTPAVTFSITFPRGLGFSFFDSSLSREELSESDGRQTLTYHFPVCTSNEIENCDAQSDSVRFGFVIGWEYIFWQLSGYIFGLLGLIILLFYIRRRRKAQKKKGTLQKENDRVANLRIKQAEITGNELYSNDGLPDMDASLQGLDSKGNIPSEGWDEGYEDLLKWD
ncbi:MAG: hypothetical protein QF440_00520, partial [Candidatus Thalassarchaeaceae archaeon]|nr:hypothetical protein [Candidatus Thalassarchaeaceae archaeon]